MALVSGRGSTLNPNARPFIPAVYRQVEDFSSELVQNSTWFPDYWQSEHQEPARFEGLSDPKEDDITRFLPDSVDVSYDEEFLCVDAEFDEFVSSIETYGNRGLRTETQGPNGHGFDAGALMKSLNAYSLSSTGRSAGTQVKPLKYNDGVAQSMGPNHGPRCVHRLH